MTYRIGYGEPPREHQFQKGQSGNPKGRPKRVAADDSQSDEAIKYIEKALRRKAKFTDRGVVKSMTTLEASINKQVNEVIVEGDQKSFTNVLKLVDMLELLVREGRTKTPLRIFIEGGLPDN